MIGVLVGRHIIVGGVLIAVGAPIMAVIPLVVLVVLLGYGLSSRQIQSRKTEGRHLVREFLVLGAWSMIVLGVWSFGDVVGDQRVRALVMIIMHSIGWFVCIIAGYRQVQQILHRGYYLSSGLLLVTIGFENDLGVLIDMVASRGWLTIGIYAFACFVLQSLGYGITASIGRLLYGYVLAEIVYLVLYQTGDAWTIAVLLTMLGLLLLAWQTHRWSSDQHQAFVPHDDEEERFLDLLYEREFQTMSADTSMHQSWIHRQCLDKILRSHVTLIASSIAVTMTILMIMTLWRSSGQLGGALLISLYAIVFTYCGGWLITRQWSGVRDRGRWMSLIGVIRVVGVSIVTWFGADMVAIVGAGILGSVGLGLFLVYESIVMDMPLFAREDRLVWLRGVIGVTIVVPFLATQLPFSLQLIFALICIYLGVQGVIIWIVVQFMKEY